MKPRAPDARRLDVAAFAAEGGRLAGTWPLAELPRLAASRAEEGATAAASADADARTDEVHWQADGEARPVAGGPAEIWMDLSARVRMDLTCQRCLAPVAAEVHAARRFRFVAGEQQAAALDGEIEEEVLALTKSLDLRELVEDELLLALPLVPRHAVCPEPPTLQFGDIASATEEQTNPFAALAALRKPEGAD